MDQPDARLKAGRIDLQIDEVQRRYDTKQLKVYNVSPLLQKLIAWLLGRTLIIITINKWYNLTFVEWSYFKQSHDSLFETSIQLVILF